MKSPATKFIHFLFLIVLIDGVFASPSKAENSQPGPVGVVKEMKGDATMVRNGRRINVAKLAPVFLHDEFTTASRSSIKISLNGGGELDLGESSSVRIDTSNFSATTDSTLIELLAGKMHSIVPFSLGKTNFTVRTGNAICGVRGTEFDTSYIVGKPCPGFPKCLRYTDVGVHHGIVEVRSITNPTAKPVRVTAGYETTVPCEIPPSSPSPVGASELELPGYR